MPKLITKTKAEWAKQFKVNSVSKGTALEYSTVIEGKYQADLTKMMNEVIKKTEVALRQIYRSDEIKQVGMDASLASQARIRMNKLERDLNKMLGKKIDTAVGRMLRATDQHSKSTLHMSIKELSGGLSIKTDFESAGTKDAITSSFNSNSGLIKSMTDNYRSQMTGAVNRSIQGGGLETLIPDVQKLLTKQNKMLLNKAKNVALDQTRKAYTAINVARMEKVGINKFEWMHSGGGREPRPYHKNKFPSGLNGGIFDINDPPVVNQETGARGLPGTEIFCKCRMRPIVQFEDGSLTT